jgi:hypothetical protein
MNPQSGAEFCCTSHSPHDGLSVPRLEVHCPQPCPEATDVTIPVPSPCYGRPLVSQQPVDLRGSGCSTIRRPNQGHDRELQLKVS